MDDLFDRLQQAYRRLVRRYGTGFGFTPPQIPKAAYKGLYDAIDGIGLDEPGWA